MNITSYSKRLLLLAGIWGVMAMSPAFGAGDTANLSNGKPSTSGVALPPADATPEAKNAFVLSELKTMFPGMDVTVSLLPFPVVRGIPVAVTLKLAAGKVAEMHIILRAGRDEAEARENLKQLKGYSSPEVLTVPGFDECYLKVASVDKTGVSNSGKIYARSGVVTFEFLDASTPEKKAVLEAMGKGILTNPRLLSMLVPYAATMHDVNAEPLKAALDKARARVPALSLPVNPKGYIVGNELVADFDNLPTGKIHLEALNFDSSVKAESYFKNETLMSPVTVPKIETYHGVDIYGYTSMYVCFEAGKAVFLISGSPRPLMHDLSAALIDEMQVVAPTIQSWSWQLSFKADQPAVQMLQPPINRNGFRKFDLVF